MSGKQCLYVADWSDSVIPFAKGVEDMLGYPKHEFNFLFLTTCFHPDDKAIVEKIIHGAMDHITTTKNGSLDLYHLMTYRMRKKNGNYIKVLRKTMGYEFDSQNVMISNMSLLTDISFMNSSNKVDWELHVKDLNVEKLRQDIHQQFIGFFSERELEIIKMIKGGFTSNMIATETNISIHTVATHRKNILRKIGGGNIAELLSFCEQNGII